MSTITGFDNKTHGWSKAIVQNIGGVDIADAFLRGEYELVRVAKAVASALFVIVGTVSIAATTENFVAKDKFVVNVKADAEVKISHLGKNFINWFMVKIEQRCCIQSKLIRGDK